MCTHESLRRLRLLTRLVSLFLLMSRPAAAQQWHSMILGSGNTPVGTQDPLVWVQGSSLYPSKPPSSGLPLQHPFVVAPISTWGTVAGAQWVSPQPDGMGAAFGYEYYINFDLPPGVIMVILDAEWLADDASYSFLNGVLIPVFASFGGKSSVPAPGQIHMDVTGLVHGGTNRLSFAVSNTNPSPNPTDPTGVDFWAVVSYLQ